MIALIDTSVLLRKLFGEPEALTEWTAIQDAYASRVLLVELGRALDRGRLAGDLDDEQLEHLQRESRRILRSVEIIGLSDRVLARAAGPMPTSLGTLDALHLATALELSARRAPGLIIATHDRQLARAARSSGLDVVGA